MLGCIRLINKMLGSNQKRKLVILFFMALVGAILETVGISSLLPLISVIVMPENAVANRALVVLSGLTGVSDKKSILIVLMVAVAVLFIIKNVYMLILSYVQNRFVYNNQVNASNSLMIQFLNKPYEYFLNTNYNYIAKIVINDVTNAYSMLLSVVRFATELAVFAFIILAMLLIDYKMTLVVFALVIVTMLCLHCFVRPLMKRIGDDARIYGVEANKWFYQAFNGIKEVKVYQKQELFRRRWEKNYRKCIKAEHIRGVTSSVPQIVIESLFVVGIITFLLIYVMMDRDIVEMLPQLSAFGVAAIRIMPCANRMNSYLNSAVYYKTLLLDLDYHLRDVTNSKSALSMKNGCERILPREKIELKDITFGYTGSEKMIFIGQNMEIPIGKSVAIIGESGGGKTTLADVILGLLTPKEGCVLVDGVEASDNYEEWLGNIGYIPQVIYLMDDNIRNNVAYGMEEENIDDERVWEVLEEAQVADFVRTLPEKLDTMIGDRGVKLSGGQRQRLGIARALYHDPSILIFDEATSSLDNETEMALVESINSFQGKKTMIIIAHRLSTIENCDITYKISQGKIEKVKG